MLSTGAKGNPWSRSLPESCLSCLLLLMTSMPFNYMRVSSWQEIQELSYRLSSRRHDCLHYGYKLQRQQHGDVVFSMRVWMDDLFGFVYDQCYTHCFVFDKLKFVRECRNTQQMSFNWHHCYLSKIKFLIWLYLTSCTFQSQSRMAQLLMGPMSDGVA